MRSVVRRVRIMRWKMISLVSVIAMLWWLHWAGWRRISAWELMTRMVCMMTRWISLRRVVWTTSSGWCGTSRALSMILVARVLIARVPGLVIVTMCAGLLALILIADGVDLSMLLVVILAVLMIWLMAGSGARAMIRVDARLMVLMVLGISSVLL